MSDIVEIIDLTSPKPPTHDLSPNAEPSPSHSEPIEVADSGSPSEQTPSTPDGQARKKKKRRTKRSTMNANAAKEADVNESRAPSAEPQEPPTETRSAKRKRERDENTPEESNEYPTRETRRRERKERRREERMARERDEEQDAPPPAQDLFFVDVAPAPISSSIVSAPTTTSLPSDSTTENAEQAKLLVPAHVTVLGSTPVEIIQPLAEGEEDEDFINYLDYEDSRHMLRYYDEVPDENIVINRTVCKNCGAEGEHKTSACTIQICLTCGVRNEHSTRSCPISKVCFTCGMKGHINANCPNRRTARALQSSRELECDRCSSSNHKTNECPTVWRLYEYFTVEQQSHIVTVRQSKKDLKVGQGGEGYVADDEWCYYCGQCGHWGDDCQDMDRPPAEHSAFSRYNIASGPFYDPGNERKASTSRPRIRDWESTAGNTWKDAPDNVGRQGRMKSRAALERQAQDAEDDVDDWFGGAAKRSGPALAIRGAGLPQKPVSSKGFVFGKSMGSGRKYEPPTDNGRPSLLDRLGGDDRKDGNDSRSRSSYHDRERSHKRSYRDRDRDRDDTGGGYDSRRRRDDRSSYSDRRRHDSGPRYRGGYVAR